MRITFLFFLIAIALMGFSQTGPGGVGKTDGTSSLVLWLNASTIAGTNATTITSWTDRSGYGNNFAVGNGAVFYTSRQNGYAAFAFNGTSHYFQKAYTASLSTNAFTIFSAVKVNSTAVHKCLMSNRDDPSPSPTKGFTLYALPTTNYWEYWTNNGVGLWAQVAGNVSTAGNWAGVTFSYENTASAKKIYINGALNSTSTPTVLSPNTVRPIRIGAGNNEGGPLYFFSGDMAEIIQYNTVLNSAQQIIVNNYLASKYNYTLTANNLFDKGTAGNGNYDHDVAGIGRIDASNIHNDAQGTGMVRILNPAGLGDNEFLFWGHDNGLKQASNKSDIPAGVQGRFVRVWRVSEVNTSNAAADVGAIDIRWDLTNLGSVTASHLRLLVDTDNDGTFADETPISGATSLGSNIYAFAGVTAIANNVRFTLATTNAATTPLPIELVDFNVLRLDNTTISIKWKTASESNNNYFNVEHSIDGTAWESIAKIKGAGNSIQLLNYSVNDTNGFIGTSYYRLKQTDFDGKYAYSEIRTVTIINLKESDVIIYPNPAATQAILKSDQLIDGISIYNVSGIEVTSYIEISEYRDAEVELNLSRLPSGVYYLKIKSQPKFVGKLIKINP